MISDSSSSITSGFARLTWEDLVKWAGQKVVSRGKSYKRAVKELGLTPDPDGGILAWVQGTAIYATHVWMDKTAQLQSACSCPYDWGPCKHAVALILVYLDAFKNKTPLEPVKPQDRRLKLLNAMDKGESYDDDDLEESDLDDIEDNYDDDDDSQAMEDEVDEPEEKSVLPKKCAKSKGSKRQSDQILRDHFSAMSNEELIDFAVNQAKQQRDIGREIVERDQLKGGKINKLVQSLRHEIERLTHEPAWTNHWRGTGELPDYTHVRTQLAALLNAGQADEVISLGKDLWRLGNEQIGQSHDEGETAGEIGECMDVVLQALGKSNRPSQELLLFAIDVCMADEYSALGEGWYKLSDRRFRKTAWREAAEVLNLRLESLPVPVKGASFHDRYEREKRLRWVIQSYERAGMQNGIIPLLEREAPRTGYYGDLVSRLHGAKRIAEAREWAVKGFRETVAELPGIAWELEGKLREMAASERDYATVAAYRALEFFHQPSLRGFQDLLKAGEAAKVGTAVREAALKYLETGYCPDLAPSPDSNTKRKSIPHSKPWPLPLLEIRLVREKYAQARFPDISTLIAIAIHEKRNHDVVRLHESSMRNRLGFGSYRDEEVAVAVKETHPDTAIAIWIRLAEGQIKLVKPAAYHEAARHLRRMRAVYEGLDRMGEWGIYLQTLRVQHKAKRSLMQVLDSIEGITHPSKRIIDG